MGATIQVCEGVRNRFKLLARIGETDEELLQRLMRYVEEMDLEEIIDARWELLQKRKRITFPWKKLDESSSSSQSEEVFG
jgi:hypothetical protein